MCSVNFSGDKHIFKTWKLWTRQMIIAEGVAAGSIASAERIKCELN